MPRPAPIFLPYMGQDPGATAARRLRSSGGLAREAAVLTGRYVRGDVVGDVLGVPAYAMDHHGRHRVEEFEPYKVQARHAVYDAALVDRSFGSEDGEIDPGEAGMVPRAPDDVCHFQHPTVFQQWQSVSHADHSGGVLDAGGGQIA